MEFLNINVNGFNVGNRYSWNSQKQSFSSTFRVLFDLICLISYWGLWKRCGCTYVWEMIWPLLIFTFGCFIHKVLFATEWFPDTILSAVTFHWVKWGMFQSKCPYNWSVRLHLIYFIYLNSFYPHLLSLKSSQDEIQVIF